MAILRQILNEAAERHGFVSPVASLKPLKMRRTDVQPFTSRGGADCFCPPVRPDYRDYLAVRCFTGMRSGEVDGLQWKYIDFERRLILIRETRVLGEDEYTKTDGSQREIQMSRVVFDALKRQEKATRSLSKYVFCNREGNPIDNKNFVERIWNPAASPSRPRAATALPAAAHRGDAVACRRREPGVDRAATRTCQYRDAVQGVFALRAQPDTAGRLGDGAAAVRECDHRGPDRSSRHDPKPGWADRHR